VQSSTDDQTITQRNIVIVDDDPAVLRVHSRMIGLMGHNLTVFECPEQSLHYLQEHADTVDLLITDYHMPGFNGLDLIARLRDAGAGYPAIILTAHPYDVDGDLAKACNALVIAKPVPMQVLAGHICSA